MQTLQPDSGDVILRNGSTLRLRTLGQDSQLQKAVELLDRAPTQRELFTLAERAQPARPTSVNPNATAQKP